MAVVVGGRQPEPIGRLAAEGIDGHVAHRGAAIQGKHRTGDGVSRLQDGVVDLVRRPDDPFVAQRGVAAATGRGEVELIVARVQQAAESPPTPTK